MLLGFSARAAMTSSPGVLEDRLSLSLPRHALQRLVSGRHGGKGGGGETRRSPRDTPVPPRRPPS